MVVGQFNVVKLKLDQFLRHQSSIVRTPLSEYIEPVDIHGVGLCPFLDNLYQHSGVYEINGIQYDSVIFTGSDNVYFSYEFNSNSGRALAESLFILSSLQITQTSDNTYELVEPSGNSSILVLRNYSGKEL